MAAAASNTQNLGGNALCRRRRSTEVVMKIRSQQPRRRNTMLRELAELIVEGMQRCGVPPHQASDEAKEIAFRLHRRWAGITFVFPVNDELARERLILHILERYDGTNADKLVQEFGVTEDWIYTIVRRHRRQLDRLSRDQQTFDFDTTDH
ncbi:hypothetical protein HBO42_08005 [Pseudomonas aeruginosa]|nr:hypothetical protein [Pseudomonas aeruginosa]ORE41891.1 hypothetical protein B1H15_26135 [Pseudomonas aeruginosa]